MESARLRLILGGECLGLCLMLLCSLSLPELTHTGLLLSLFEVFLLLGFRDATLFFSLILAYHGSLQFFFYLVLKYSLPGQLTRGESIILSQSIVFLYVNGTPSYPLANNTPWFLILYWVVMIIGLVLLSSFMVNKWLLTKTRKIFHLFSLLMFIPGIYLDLAFLRLSLFMALCLGVALEWIRPPLIREWMSQFLDEKDSGKRFILSHIYLLFGCSFPILFVREERETEFILSSGILILCVGDSIACLFGSVFGQNRWNEKTKKTLEGSFFAFIVMCFILIPFREFYFSNILCIWLAIVLEGCTLENDNLVVPIFFCSLLRILARIREDVVK